MHMGAKNPKEFVFRQSITILLVGILLGSWVYDAQSVQKVYDDLFSASFPNEREGWASGRWGCILYTEDGGKTWARQKTETDVTLSSVSFVDSKNGWAVGDMGMIIHTKDGGKTWEKQKSPVPFRHMKVQFISPTKGWIVSEQSHILYTEDGGKNWTIQFKARDIILKSISFCDPLHGWAAGEYGYIYYTRNGGKTWEKQAGRYELSEKTGEMEGGNFLFDVMAVNPQAAWAVGIDGYVIRTGDSGKTWQEVATGAPKTQLFAVNADRNIILVAGNGAILMSSDDGKSWRIPEFKPSVIYDWIYGITRLSSEAFLTVGSGGAIYINEGNPRNSWKRVNY